MTKEQTLTQIQEFRHLLLELDAAYRAHGSRVSATELAESLKATRMLMLSVEIDGLKNCFLETSNVEC